MPNPDIHEVIGQQIDLAPSKVFFGINLIREKMRLPRLDYPKRRLAVTPEQLMAIETLYEPYLPLPPLGIHKIISKQLHLDEWRVHVAIGLIRKNRSLSRWNEDREDLSPEMKEAQKKAWEEKEREKARQKAEKAAAQQASKIAATASESEEGSETPSETASGDSAPDHTEKIPEAGSNGVKPKKVRSHPKTVDDETGETSVAAALAEDGEMNPDAVADTSEEEEDNAPPVKKPRATRTRKMAAVSATVDDATVDDDDDAAVGESS